MQTKPQLAAIQLNKQSNSQQQSVSHTITANSPLRKTYFRLRQIKQQNISPLKFIHKSSPKKYSDFYTHQQITLQRIKIREAKLSNTANNFFIIQSRTQKIDPAKNSDSPMRKTLYSSPRNEKSLMRPPTSQSLILRRTSLNLRIPNVFKDQNSNNYLNKYQIIRELGKGSFSTVFLARRRQKNAIFNPEKQSRLSQVAEIDTTVTIAQKMEVQNAQVQYCEKTARNQLLMLSAEQESGAKVCDGRELVAIKVYQKFKMNSDPHKFKNIRKEVNIMQNLDHEGVLKLYEHVETLTKINLVVQYAGDQSLLDYVKRNYPLSLHKVKDISLQLIKAIAYLHDKSIVHRDIKLQNILINHDQIKLIDFGFSCLTHKNQKLTVICGTPNYMAPEVISRKEYVGQQADIWSYGVVVYALGEGRHPFKADTYGQLEKLIARGRFEFKKTNDQPFSEFIKRILKLKGSERPTARQIMQSKWFKSPSNSI